MFANLLLRHSPFALPAYLIRALRNQSRDQIYDDISLTLVEKQQKVRGSDNSISPRKATHK